MTQEALKLALEALYPIAYNTTDDPRGQAYKAITAIKEALAQPERDYERGFVDGMQKQMQSSVDKAVNRMAQTQEPVAWMHVQGNFEEPSFRKLDAFEINRGWTQYPLYPTPPQRTWVGLTDEDKKQMFKEANYHWEMTAGEYAERIGQLTEAKLKEKNGA